MPVFGGFAGEPALNELGDPVTANESGIMERLGLFAFYADPGNDKDIYKDFADRKYWPSQTSRRSFDKKYGGLVGQEVYYEYGRIRGQEIQKEYKRNRNRLKKLDDKKFKSEMSSIISKAGKKAERKLRLKPVKEK